MAGKISIENLMVSNFGETKQVIKAEFKKTINIKQYETEVFTAETEISIDSNLTSAERMLIVSALQAQLEYQVYIGLTLKGYVTSEEFNERRVEIENNLNALKQKSESVLNKSLDYIFEIKA